MSSFWDFATIAVFAGLIVLFLQRSMGDEPTHDDPMWRYLAAAVGCAVANYLGNEVSGVAAAVVLIATLLFILLQLRPFPQFPRR
jgi:hypothetical protein